MHQHPLIDDTVAAFDDVEQRISRLYDLAAEAKVRPDLLEEIHTANTRFGDNYRRAIVDLRSATTHPEWDRAVNRLEALSREGELLFKMFQDDCVTELRKMRDDIDQSLPFFKTRTFLKTFFAKIRKK